TKYLFPAEAKTVSPEFVRAGTRLAALEMIQSGTTTYADMYYFEEEIARETAFLKGRWPSGLAAGVIHADLFPDNVFFLGDRISGLIDFYFACNDLLAYDLAICLNAWCFEQPNAINVTKARALLRSYNERRPMDAAEIEALPILARGSALRFLLTRLYDWFHTDGSALVKPKDPLEYRRKLRFHQQVNAPSDYGL
ncbi:MAG: phosphotransferase, partial [Rhodomicrobium sp.]|nr:phosphotransferase [Rhodomicrobium sp.]